MIKISHNNYSHVSKHKAVIRTNILSGAIVGLRVIPTSSNSFIRKLQPLVPIFYFKRVYFWLPYKHMVPLGTYGMKGPKSRAPYSNRWFEIKQNHTISSLTTSIFISLVLKEGCDYEKAKIKSSFLPNELIKVTSKPLKKTLDKIFFNFYKKHQNE